MANGTDNKFIRNIAIVGGAVALLLVVFALAQLKSRLGQSPTPAVTNPNKVENYQDGTLPPAFPKSIPIESKAKITNSYTATSPDGKSVQSTVSFESSESVQANYNLYKALLSSGGWKLSQTANDSAEHKALLGQNSAGYLTINITKINDSSTSVVISFMTL